MAYNRTCPVPQTSPWLGFASIPGKTWWRMEIHGRPGWFTPAFEAAFLDSADEPTIHHALILALEANGYRADAELGETYHLRRL